MLCMLINLDKFLVEELNNRGFACDYKSMVEIYRASRELPACKRRKIQKAREEELMDRIEAQVIAARMAEQSKQAKKTKTKKVQP